MMNKFHLLIFLMTISLGFAQPDASPSDPPTRNAWDVFSVYSNAYSNQAGVQFFTFNNATINDDYTPTGGNPAKYYTGHSYSGIQVNTAGSLDVSQMTHLHFDVWSPNFSSMNIKLESTTGVARELAVAGTIVPSSTTRSQWISVDLALSTYNTGNILSNLKYIVPVTYAQNATMYVDNIYFYRPTTTSQPPTFGEFTVPAKLVGDANFTIDAPNSNSNGAITYTSSNSTVATVVNGNQLHIVGAGTSIITANQAAAGSYVAGSTTAALNVTYPALTADAPAAPARNYWDVISLYSSSYSNISGTDWFPGWGQSTTYTTYTPSSNETHLYQNLNYQGVQLNGNKNVSSMTTMHVDIYSPDATALDFRIIAGGEFNKTLTLVPGQWNSFDIPLSDYGDANLTVLNQLKFQTNPFGALRNVVYLDNIYFYRAQTDLPSPTITNFSVPAKSMGSSSFAISAPTSDSTGAFSYTSSNTSVATVTGSTITIVGLGSTTITATQAASADYSSGFVTTVFDVTPVAAPSPTVDASHVFSLYSDAYSNMAGINWNPNWGGTSTQVADVSIDGNTTRKYTTMDFRGVQFASPLNLSSMVSLHLDIWTQNCTSFDVYLVNQAVREQKVTLSPSANGWNSFDILLSAYSTIDMTNVGQFKFVATPSGTSNVYVDNIYFSDVAITVAPIISGFTITTKELGVDPFVLSAPTSSSTGAFTYTSSNTDVATIDGSTVTVVGIGSTTITANQAASGNYTSGSINTNLTVIAPLPTSPDAAAPAPPSRNAGDVKSLYSGAYANINGTNWNPGWGQSTIVSEVTIADDNTRLYSNMNYQGVQFGSPINASAMTHLHIDIWTSTCNSFDVYLVNQGIREQKVTVTPTLGGWNSYDILLSLYTNIDMTNIGQFKFVATPSGSKVYADNIYFWKPNTTPNIGEFTVPAKLVGDASFAITAPESNSTGAFTYTSSNTSVATISGNMLTVVGAGTTTITANQAAAAPLTAGSTSAVFTVSYPGPSIAAPTPTVNASNVKSLYSNAYTNVGNIDWVPNWGQSTSVTNTTAGGNDVKKYSNMNFQGVQFASPINATTMTYLHIDVWTPNCTALDVYLVNQAVTEQKVTLTPTLFGWNSFDIALSQYDTIDLTNIGQFKFVATPAGTSEMYFDNIYFHSAPLAPTASEQTYCAGSTVANLVAVGSSLQWYDVATAGSALASTTALTTGTYYVSQSVNGVESNRTAASVTINATPALASQSYFVNGGIPLSSVPGYGSSYNVYTSASAVTALPSSTVLTSGTYYASQTQNGCESTRSLVTVVVYSLTSVSSPACGTRLNAITAPITATAVANATNYLFEVTGNGSTRTIYSSTNSFNLTQLQGTNAYNTAYSIRVAAGFNGQYGNFGATCSLTTPALANTTQVISTQCGAILASMTTPIYCGQIVNAQAYRFGFTTGGVSRYIDSATNNVQIGNLTGGAAYGTAYSVRVAAQVGGSWQAFGTACTVTTPAAKTQVRTNQCGTTLAGKWSILYCSAVTGATAYRFEWTNGGSTLTYTSSLSNMQLGNYTGWALNTTYSVRVAVQFGGSWQDYGSACNVKTPATMARGISEGATALSIKAVPNPFETEYVLMAQGGNQTPVQVSVYDMLGKQVDQFSVEANELENRSLGTNYTSGIYNVMISQGDEQQVVRIVKK